MITGAVTSPSTRPFSSIIILASPSSVDAILPLTVPEIFNILENVRFPTNSALLPTIVSLRLTLDTSLRTDLLLVPIISFKFIIPPIRPITFFMGEH